MKRSGLQFALLLSLLLNLGVIGAAGYLVVTRGQVPAVFGPDTTEASLPDYLKLNAGQRRQWHDLEKGFLKELAADWDQIRAHRRNMINEIFAEQPDRSRIEAERAAIAELQATQQQRVIAQLLKERDIIDPGQRQALAELLLRQAPTGAMEGRLHGQ
jgi:Spy/CpxP family protein refolding chaperone